jgi:4-amino-4-deoxy-L-arabinose transferase-like glycosyltransferase
MESFDTYKFEELNPIPAFYDDFFANAGHDDFIRTPAYPLFLGIIYKLFGISPKVVKALQLLMLVTIAASLPFIGDHYWGKSGYIGGIPAGALYLATNYKLADHILTESLTAFAVFLVLVSLIIYERWESILTACVLGVSMGIGLLVKGSLIFLPILTWGVVLFRGITNRNSAEIKRLLVIMVSTVFMLLPWSLYASAKSNEFIFLSSQGAAQLLADNNELCVDGVWHPEWVDNKNAFYYTDGINNNHAIEKVINFYWHHPTLLPQCMFQKFLNGFGPLPFLWIFIGFMLLDGMFKIAIRWKKSDFASLLTGRFVVRIPVSFWIVGGNFLLITLLFHGEATIVRSRLVAPMDFVFALLCCVPAVRLFSIIYKDMKTN